jgi:hypothetical protein
MNNENRIPQAGDVVELTGPWFISETGHWGVINGRVGKSLTKANVTFNLYGGRAHRHVYPSGEVVDASGGPVSTDTPVAALKPTDRKRTVTFWRWRNNVVGAGQGENYQLEVPVWEWDGKE